MRNLQLRTPCWLLLSALLLFSLGNTVVWLWRDTRPPRWDEAGYLAMSLRHYDALTTGGMSAMVHSWFRLERIRPPLVPALVTPAYLLFGRRAYLAFTVNLLGFVMTILAVYGIGVQLQSRYCGLLAAFFVAMYPGVLSLSRLFLLDFFDMALAACTLYALIRTEGWTRTKPAVAVGLGVGLGLLCRAFFLIFLIGPLLISTWVAWHTGRRTPETRGQRRPTWQRNGGLACLVCLLVAAPWYLLNIVPVVLRSLSAAYGAEAIGYGPANPLTLAALASYAIHFTNVHTAPVGMCLWLLALLCLWYYRARRRSVTARDSTTPWYHLMLLLASILIPGVFFATLPSQDIKNILPVLPAMAALTAWGLMALPPSLWRNSVVIGSVCWCLGQCWLGTYGYAALPQQISLSLGETLPPLLLLQQGLTYPPGETPLFPRAEQWPIPEILARITGGFGGPGKTQAMLRPASVAILPDHPLFNGSTFDYFARLNRLPLHIDHYGDPRVPEGQQYRVQLLGADFVITKTGDAGPAWLNVYNEEIQTFLRTPDSGFVEIEPRFPLPDGSEAVLYTAQHEPVVPVLPTMQAHTSVRFGEHLELLGHTLHEVGRTRQGRAFFLIYYWRALRPVPYDWQVSVHITPEAPQAAVIRRWDHAPARGRYPTSWWSPGAIIADRGLYFLPEAIPAGTYQLWLGLTLPVNGSRLPVTQAPPGIPLDTTETRVATVTLHMPSATDWRP